MRQTSTVKAKTTGRYYYESDGGGTGTKYYSPVTHYVCDRLDIMWRKDFDSKKDAERWILDNQQNLKLA